MDKSRQFRLETVPSYDDMEFSRHFRMSRTTFTKLLEILSPFMPTPYSGFGKSVIPPRERLYIVLWYVASNETYRQLACRFGTTDSVIHESVEQTLQLLVDKLAHEVKFPATDMECKAVAARFQQKNGFPGIVGAIDGTRVNISRPKTEPDAWVDRKGHHSISITAVVDSDKRFLYYSVGCPGSLHDQRVLRLGYLTERLAPLSNIYHLIGDSAYHLTTKMMVPYPANTQTEKEKAYNYKHSCNRLVVEHAFGLLKTKFPRIHGILQVKSWDMAVLRMRSCIHLHNFILNNELPDSDELVTPGAAMLNLPEDARAKRDAISDILADTS